MAKNKKIDFGALGKDKNKDKKVINVYHAGRTSHVEPEDRAKISITISKTLLDDMDIALIKNDALIESLGNHGNRSNMIHMALLDYLEKFKE